MICTLAYWLNESVLLSCVVMRFKIWCWKTNWSWMNQKLKYLCVDHQLGWRVSLSTAFWLASVHSILQCSANTRANFGCQSLFWSACLICCQILFFSNPWAKSVHTSLKKKATNSISVSFNLSMLDYCNSLLASLPQIQIKRLQATQNAAARTAMKGKKTDFIMPILRELHWLSTHDSIHNKLLSATYLPVHRNTTLSIS